MIRKVKKGHNRFSPPIMGLHLGNPEMAYKIIFHDSCRYIPNGEEDWNKLFGWSYGLLPVRMYEVEEDDLTVYADDVDLPGHYVMAHHYNSDRVGWRYDAVRNAIEICLYSYVDGARVITTQGIFVPLEEEVWIDMGIENELTDVTVWFPRRLNGKHNRIQGLTNRELDWGYKLGGYFGGYDSILGYTTPAPHDMEITYIKI